MSKQKRTNEFKIRSLVLHLIEELKPKEAFLQACQEFNTIPSGCMTDYSVSYMYDYKVWIKKVIKENDERICGIIPEALASKLR